MTTRYLTQRQSRELGRAEYFNPKNKGKTVWQVMMKYLCQHVLPFWRREFIRGWYGATMLCDEEFALLDDVTIPELTARPRDDEAMTR